MAEIGYVTLILALLASIYSIIAFVISARGGEHPRLLASAKNSLLAVSVLVTISVAVLLAALINHDFQIKYVYQYTSSDLSLPYLISALWAGNAGSLLFWGWLLSLFAAVVVLKKRAHGRELLPYASAIVMFTEAFFLVLLLFAQNPFTKLSTIPTEGYGLNPLLENPGMIFHPPLLLGGYAIIAIPFAFAISALITRKLDDWISAIKKWALLGWLLLGMGNLIGAWWAYAELGWGGYWSWDPVENAGLMPWLVMTAFLHSIMLQKRRGTFKLWNMALIISAFALTIFGTFITRSDILSSIHTFGETAMDPLFIAFLIITLLGSLVLLFYRRRDLESEAGTNALISRENTFLLNNILLAGATFTIFMGTVFGSEKTFFNQVAIPFLLAIVLLSGICILIAWRRTAIEKLRLNLLWPAVVALIVVIALLIAGRREWYALIPIFLCSLAISAVLSQWFQDVFARSRAKAENYLTAFFNLLRSNKSRYGGYIVHIAIVIIAIGVIGSSVYDVETEAKLTPGGSMTINDYSLTYEGLDWYPTPSKMVVNADVSVYKGDRFISTLSPEVYFHSNFEQGVSEVAIRSTLTEDLYVILAGWEPVDSEDLSQGYIAGFRVCINPLVIWIWIGGGIFLLGGLLAFWSERRR